MKYLVIGCGLTGSVIARHLAEKGHEVEVWERRNHIGGNMYDYLTPEGVRVHQYGPHVFHTYNPEMKKYMEQWCEWVPFPITSQVFMLNRFTPSPFNYKTIDDYYSTAEAVELKAALEETYPNRETATIVEMLESNNAIVKNYAHFLYVHDYRLYTAKQWGIKPEDIDPSVLKRVPVRFTYKDGYFDDPCQMIPMEGYAAIFERMLDHPNITVRLSYEAHKHLRIQDNKVQIGGEPCSWHVIYTGAVDELLNKKFGTLPYRSLRFRWETVPWEQRLSAPLIAYPEEKDFTRITEYGCFPQRSNLTVTCRAYEYPVKYHEGTAAEPYYPILTEDSQIRYAKYRAEANRISQLTVCGRLGDYEYYNMDAALLHALDVCAALETQL